jgi:hypothetical protein
VSVAVDQSSSAAFSGTPSAAWPHSCAGENRFLLVGIALLSRDARTVTGVTYNGVPLMLKGGRTIIDATDIRAEQWFLVHPDAGTHDVVITFQQPDNYGAAGAVSFTAGAGDAWAVGDQVTAIGVASPFLPPIITVPSETGAVVADVVVGYDHAPATPGGGQFSRWVLTSAGVGSAGSTKLGSGSVDMAWSDPYPSFQNWAQCGVSITAAPSNVHLTLAAGSGAFALLGRAADLNAHRRLAVAHGAFSTFGRGATMTLHRSPSAAPMALEMLNVYGATGSVHDGQSQTGTILHGAGQS